MGAGNYTKEEKEFCESIMKEIKKHQDFGKRNPVDIGIECGYSEDDVMGMIYMCQDIVKEEKKAADKKEIPVREDWELEGIIPFEDFVKIDFPETIHFKPVEVYHLWHTVCYDELNLNTALMDIALQCANQLKSKSLLEAVDGNYLITDKIIWGFEDISKWMTVYATVARKIFEGDDNTDILLLQKPSLDAVEKLIREEIRTKSFCPLDDLIIKANEWDEETIAATDKNERDEARKAIAE